MNKCLWIFGVSFLTIGIGLMIVGGIKLGGFPDRYKQNVTYKDGTFDETLENITKLDLEVSAAKINIKNGENTDKILVTYHYDDRSELISSKENGTYKLKVNKNKSWYYNVIGTIDNTIDIYLPLNSSLDLNIESSACDLNMEEIKYNKVNFDMAAGKFVCKGIEASQDVDINIAAGQFILDKIKCPSLDLDMSAGSATVSSCDINSTLNLDVSAGEANVTMVDEKRNYSIYVDKSAGSSNVTSSSGGNKVIDIDVSAGSANVFFK